MRQSGGPKAGEPAPDEANETDGQSADGVPRHVAIIMDGNGRWAEKSGKNRLAGHRAGAEAVRAIVRTAARRGIEVLTLYAFSTENWSRPRTEVTGLFALLKRFLKSETPELKKEGIRLRAIGRIDDIDAGTRAALSAARDATAPGTNMTLCLALNYGAQDELVDATRALALKARDGMIDPEAIERADIEQNLYTSGLPPVDLLIRTGGDRRVSNFLLWQMSYAELWFTETCWPDFGEDQFDEALRDYSKRERRFGRI